MHSLSQSTLSQSRWTNQDIKRKADSDRVDCGAWNQLLEKLVCGVCWLKSAVLIHGIGIELLSEFDAFAALAHAPAVAIPQ